MKVKLVTLASSFIKKPKYTLMRMFARFVILRFLVREMQRIVFFYKTKVFLADCERRKVNTLFSDVNADEVVSDLNKYGVAFGLRLPEGVVKRIYNFSCENQCYADRDVAAGFDFFLKSEANEKIGKNILVAQYFNTLEKSPDIKSITTDPILEYIACKYLGVAPKFVGANLWWTFPVDASEADKSRHAHLFHRDVDDFKFLKFFFYLTDVEDGDGAHVCVSESQGNPPIKSFFDRWNIRRYTDGEVYNLYNSKQINEINGEAGTGFAEDTWCIHKGKTPEKEPRLLLQIQFALFDYGAMNDVRDEGSLESLTL